MSDQVLEVPFAGGPDDQTDPRLLAPGSVVSAFNQVYDQDGSYQPRFGYVSIGTHMENLRRFAVFAEELIGIDGTQLWSRDAHANNWSFKDRVPAPGVTHRPLFNTSSTFLSWNAATGNGYRVVTWIDGVDSTSVVRGAVYSAETGAMVLGPIQISASGRPTFSAQVSIIGTVALVAWVDVIGTSVGGSKLDLTNIAAGFSVPTTLSDGTNKLVDGTYQYTMCATASIFIISYETTPTGGGNNVGQFQSVSWTTSLVMQNSQKNSPGIHYYQSIAIASAAKDSGDLWIAVSAIGYITDGSGTTFPVWVIRLNPATLVMSVGPISCGAATAGTGIAKIGVDIDASTTGQCVVTFSGTGRADYVGSLFYNWVALGGPINTHAFEVPNVVMVSYPLNDTSLNVTRVYASRPTLYSGTLGNVWGSYYLLNLGTSGSPLLDLDAILAPRIVNTPAATDADTWLHTPRAYFTDASIYGAESRVFETVMPIVDNTGRQGLDFFKADFHANFRWSPASLGRENYLSGSIYDGNLLAENGFSANPFVKSATAGGGAGTFNGTYEYAVTYGRINAQGDLEESAPSIPFKATAENLAQFTVDVVSLTLSQKWRTAYGTATGTASPVYIILYRTQELTAGDTLHYRVFNEPFPAALINDQTSAITAIVDTVDDSTLTDGTHTVLYTDTTELPHNCPETFTHICAHKNRIVGIGADERTVWYSQTYSAASVPSYNELQTLTVDDTSEPLVAVASLYDKLLVFTQTRFWVIYGDGPAISGTGNDLTQPQRIPSTSGCLDPRSIVNTPLGLMFQGIQGLQLVDTGLGVTFLGRNIVNALAPYPTCVSATWCEDSSTIRFGFTADDMEDARATTGVLALFDVRRSRWAVHQLTNEQTDASVLAGGAPIAAAAWHPSLGYVTGYNQQFNDQAVTVREATMADTAPWLDYGTFFVPLVVTTAWFKGSNGAPTSVQGARRYRRVRILGNYYEAHALTATIGYDYAAPSEAHSYSSATVTAQAVGSREQVRVTPQYGKAEAIQVTVATAVPSPLPMTYTGHGAGFTGLQFEVHDRKGGYRNIGAGAKT